MASPVDVIFQHFRQLFAAPGTAGAPARRLGAVIFLALQFAVLPATVMAQQAKETPDNGSAPTPIPAPTQAAPSLHKMGVSAEDRRKRVDSGQWPWSSLGRINRVIGGHCTGALIAPDWVLTAAHCLYNFNDRRWAIPSDVHFVAGYDRGKFAGHGIAKRFVLSPGFIPRTNGDLSNITRDWALIELDRRLDLKPIPIAVQDLALGNGRAHVAVAGYSADFREVLTADQDCDVIAQLTPGPADAKLWLHDCDETFGASGAPLLHVTGGRMEIVGIQNAIITTREGREFSTAVPLSAFHTALSQISR